MLSRLAPTRTLVTAALVALGTVALAASPVSAATSTVAAAAAPTTASAALPPPSDAGFGEARILWLLNAHRHYYGLAPVARNSAADAIAQYSADVQAWYGRLGHNPNLGNDVSRVVTRNWHFVGENIGCGTDADNLHAMWTHSQGHLANMMERGVDMVGIGYAYARGCAWATVVFIDT
jgi:uncharacterized protein YkwD